MRFKKYLLTLATFLLGHNGQASPLPNVQCGENFGVSREYRENGSQEIRIKFRHLQLATLDQNGKFVLNEKAAFKKSKASYYYFPQSQAELRSIDLNLARLFSSPIICSSSEIQPLQPSAGEPNFISFAYEFGVGGSIEEAFSDLQTKRPERQTPSEN